MTARPDDATLPAPPAAVRPDYRGAWVGGVVPALLQGEVPDWVPAAAHGARAVVLLVLDGLGWAAVTGGHDRLPTLATLEGGPVTTVAPSTTGAAMTSITTGRPPSAHGIVGYRMRVGGELLSVLSWQIGRHKGPEAAAVQPHPPFLGRKVPVVSRSEFREGGFTEAHLRGSRYTGWSTTAVLVEHCRQLIEAGERFVYAYYDGVDRVAHEFGLLGSYYTAELAATDRLVAALLDHLPADCALLVTSDHGQVHVEAEGRRSLDEVAPMVASYGGEGRFRSLHAVTGASADLRVAAREAYGDIAWVLGREQLFDDGWLGDGASATVRGRLGDVVIAAREPVAFVAPDYTIEGRMRSFHGSLTPDEMLVPLLAGRGRAAR